MKFKVIAATLSALAALVAAAAVGYGVAATSVEPEVKTVTKTVTETETVYEVPEACKTAISEARDQMIELTKMVLALSKAGGAATLGNYDKASDLIDDIPQRLKDLGIGEWNETVEKCKASAGPVA